MSEFFTSMRDAAVWCEDQTRAEELTAIEEVLRFRKDSSGSAYRVKLDLENIEELFSLSSAEQNNSEITKSIQLAIGATLEYCRMKNRAPMVNFGQTEHPFVDVFGTKNAHGGGKVSLYSAMLKRLLPDTAESVTFISFNYDLVVEEAITEIRKKISYGYENPDYKNGDLYSDLGVKVLKLHGSLNSAELDDGRPVVFKSYKELRDAGYVPNLVPPTWNKAISKNLSDVWKAANSALNNATKIFIVGFSMPATDLHFKYLLAAGLKNNISLRKIFFIDPCPFEVSKKRAEAIFSEQELVQRRVDFKACRFEELFVTPDGSFLQKDFTLLDD